MPGSRRPRKGGGQTRWVAHGRGDQPVTFTWRRRVEERRADQPLRMRGSVTHLVGLGENARRSRARYGSTSSRAWRCRHAWRCRESLQVTRVTGTTVADWETVRPGPTPRQILDPVATTATFRSSAKCAAPAKARGGAADSPARRGSRNRRRRRRGAWRRRDHRAAAGSARAGRPARPRERRRRPRVSIDGGISVHADFGGRDADRSRRGHTLPTQAVMVANVDEARYQVLVTEDGKCLVRARYAVRNNRRSLLSVALPAGATLWSTSVAGRVIRPGRSPAARCSCRSNAASARDDLPPFVVEVAYLARGRRRYRGTLSLPLAAIDLPISRTGVALHHSPRFKLAAVPGTFRIEPYSTPVTAVLRDGATAAGVARLPRRRRRPPRRSRRKRRSTRSSGPPVTLRKRLAPPASCRSTSRSLNSARRSISPPNSRRKLQWPSWIWNTAAAGELIMVTHHRIRVRRARDARRGGVAGRGHQLRAATSPAAESSRNGHVVAGGIRPAGGSGRTSLPPARSAPDGRNRRARRSGQSASRQSRARHLHPRGRSVRPRRHASAADVRRDDRRRPAWARRPSRAARRRISVALIEGRGRSRSTRLGATWRTRQAAPAWPCPCQWPAASTRRSSCPPLSPTFRWCPAPSPERRHRRGTRVEATLVPAARPGVVGLAASRGAGRRATRARCRCDDARRPAGCRTATDCPRRRLGPGGTPGPG